ncbi:hypothetical protein FP2506_14464 [Fulvimarina pelagi HTCC2506]|uniref:Uncharacterized protein n=1 Tax=Fulvimarina pelagi HTCC2506 TaxID=314231 RepID=Q0G437_9HYPH|nr:hypothetical protein FP2506_14464 [Fulvimarina pelagi HTCC2506]
MERPWLGHGLEIAHAIAGFMPSKMSIDQGRS